MDLEIILQSLTILSLLAGIISFFFGVGAYKKSIEKDVEILKQKNDNNEKDVKNLRKDFEILKNDTVQNTTRI